MAICKGFLFVFPVNSDLLSSSALKAAPCWGFGTSELHAVRRLASFLGSEGQGGWWRCDGGGSGAGKHV